MAGMAATSNDPKERLNYTVVCHVIGIVFKFFQTYAGVFNSIVNTKFVQLKYWGAKDIVFSLVQTFGRHVSPFP